MTGAKFKKKLDEAANRTVNEMNIVSFIKLLMEGYDEELPVYQIVTENPYDKEMVNQVYLGSRDKRMMLCCTTFEKGKQAIVDIVKEGIVPYDMKLGIAPVSCKEMLDNAYFKPQVAAFVFNSPKKKNPFIVPFDFICPFITATGKAEKPENFQPAK